MNTDINNSSFTSINSESNIPVVTDVTETIPDTKPQQEEVSTNLENNQEMTPINSPVTSSANVENSTLVNPSTTVTQMTTTTPPITTENELLNTHQNLKTPILSSDANTTTPTPDTLGQEVSQPVASTTPDTSGQEVSQPASPPEQTKDTSKMRHRVSVRDEVYICLLYTSPSPRDRG